MNFMNMGLRHLSRQTARTLLTLLGVTLTCGACFAILGVVQGFERSIVAGLEEPGADFIIGTRGAFSLIGGSVPQTIVGKISALSNVEAATGVLLNVMTADGDQNLVVAGRPPDTFAAMQIKELAGRMPQAGDVHPIVLGESIARALSKKVGDNVEIEFTPFKVVGIAQFGSYMNRNIALVPLKDFQDLLRRQGSVSFIEVRLKRPINPNVLRESRAKLSQAAAPYDVFDTEEFVKDIRLIGIVRSVAQTITIVMLLLTLMIVANTMLMSVNERTYEFGVLMALGWTPRRVMLLVMSEGLLLTVIGGVLGMLLGLVTMLIASRLTQQAYLSPSLNAAMMMQILAGVVVVGVAGAFYPARKAVRMNAVEALRKA